MKAELTDTLRLIDEHRATIRDALSYKPQISTGVMQLALKAHDAMQCLAAEIVDATPEWRETSLTPK